MYNKDHVIKRLASDKGIPEWKVKAVYDFYWDTIYAELNKFTHQAVFVRNLGTFGLAPRSYHGTVKRNLDRYRKLKNKGRETTPIGIAQKEGLRKLLKLRSAVSKKLLYDYGVPKVDTESITECGQDCGGGD